MDLHGLFLVSCFLKVLDRLTVVVGVVPVMGAVEDVVSHIWKLSYHMEQFMKRAPGVQGEEATSTMVTMVEEVGDLYICLSGTASL